MVLGLVSSKCPSLTALTLFTNKKISKQALDKWFTEEAVQFMQCIFAFVCSFRLQEIEPCKCLNIFSSVLICDSTWWNLTKSLKLENFFKRFGGKYSKTPQCKLQIVFDYLSGRIRQIEVTESTKNDPSYHQQLLDLLQEKALLIVDLGYFSLKFFSEINKKGAYYLSRLKFGIVMYHLETKVELNLLTIAKKSKEEKFEFKALLGREKFESRVIGVKLPRAIAKERRDKYRDNCSRKKSKPNENHLEQLSWSFFITNISEKMMPASLIVLLYSIRWQIELIIKSLKSILDIDFTLVRENVNRIFCEIYGRLILAAFVTKVHSAINEISCKEYDIELSLDKTFKRFLDKASQLAESLLHSTQKAKKYLAKIINLCFKTCFKEKHSKKTSAQDKLKHPPNDAFMLLTNDYLGSLS